MIPLNQKKYFVNCHTHIFTHKHVPPWLARTYLFWPAYYLLHTGLIVRILKWWVSGPSSWQYKNDGKKRKNIKFVIDYFLYRLGFVYQIIGWFLTVQAFFVLYDFLKKILAPNSGVKQVEATRTVLLKYHLLYSNYSPWLTTFIILFILCFFKWGRNFIVFVFRKLWRFLATLPGKHSLDLAARYLNIARYSSYKKQETSFYKLAAQYPDDAAFVILPMDMEFMAAGEVKENYHDQMAELADMKKKHPLTMHPFVFVDPRRVEKEGKSFFDYAVDKTGKQVLNDCFIKTYIETNGFRGFKIYPALGYFPFDLRLLPIWKYAADNEIPIMTHCIKGTIYYRGTKKEEWNYHDVFVQSGANGTEPLLLPELENVSFSYNFTHPLNFLCLLHEEFLRSLVAGADGDTQRLFGYADKNTPLRFNLSKLKICLAHFGGDDEWSRFLEKDRDQYSPELFRYPGWGIEFFRNRRTGEPFTGKLEQLWKYTDWFSIICSIMQQYENVYADISYIVHNTGIIPLLKWTLQKDNARLRQRVLFGTDFYVVRNHKSEKNMLVDISAAISEEQFDLISRENPRSYLRTCIHGPLA